MLAKLVKPDLKDLSMQQAVYTITTRSGYTFFCGTYSPDGDASMIARHLLSYSFNLPLHASLWSSHCASTGEGHVKCTTRSRIAPTP